MTTHTDRNILAARYDDLTLAERVNATRDAHAAGYAEAKESVACGGELGEVANAVTYFYRVVEPAWHAERIDDATLAAWDRGTGPEAEGDPRVAAFVLGWTERMAELADADNE